MTVQVLGDGVQNDIYAEVERRAYWRRSKGVVYDDLCAAFVADLDHFSDVGDSHGRVCRNFEIQDLGVGSHSSLDCFGIAGVDQGGLETEAGQDASHDDVGAAVNGIGADDVVAGLQNAQQRGAYSAHAGTGGNGIVRVLKSAHLSLESSYGRVGGSCIRILGNGSAENAAAFFEGLEGIGRGLVDRRSFCAPFLVSDVARMDCSSTETGLGVV